MDRYWLHHRLKARTCHRCQVQLFQRCFRDGNQMPVTSDSLELRKCKAILYMFSNQIDFFDFDCIKMCFNSIWCTHCNCFGQIYSLNNRECKELIPTGENGRNPCPTADNMYESHQPVRMLKASRFAKPLCAPYVVPVVRLHQSAVLLNMSIMSWLCLTSSSDCFAVLSSCLTV